MSARSFRLTTDYVNSAAAELVPALPPPTRQRRSRVPVAAQPEHVPVPEPESAQPESAPVPETEPAFVPEPDPELESTPVEVNMLSVPGSPLLVFSSVHKYSLSLASNITCSAEDAGQNDEPPHGGSDPRGKGTNVRGHKRQGRKYVDCDLL